MDDDLINRIKKTLTTHKASECIFECVDCEAKFDGKKVEEFVKHQIDMSHFNYEKYKK